MAAREVTVVFLKWNKFNAIFLNETFEKLLIKNLLLYNVYYPKQEYLSILTKGNFSHTIYQVNSY